jgi:hypothetical protein
MKSLVLVLVLVLVSVAQSNPTLNEILVAADQGGRPHILPLCGEHHQIDSGAQVEEAALSTRGTKLTCPGGFDVYSDSVYNVTNCLGKDLLVWQLECRCKTGCDCVVESEGDRVKPTARAASPWLRSRLLFFCALLLFSFLP